MKKMLAAVAAAGAVLTMTPTPSASAYPGCYYTYQGCYLGPGWYGGRYWGGGPWWGWGSVTDDVMSGVNGCPMDWVNGRCPARDPM